MNATKLTSESRTDLETLEYSLWMYIAVVGSVLTGSFLHIIYTTPLYAEAIFTILGLHGILFTAGWMTLIGVSLYFIDESFTDFYNYFF